MGVDDIDTSRAVIFPDFFERQKASYDADTGQIFREPAGAAYPSPPPSRGAPSTRPLPTHTGQERTSVRRAYVVRLRKNALRLIDLSNAP